MPSPKRPTRPKPKSTPRVRQSRSSRSTSKPRVTPPEPTGAVSPCDLEALRDIFWSNIVREMLTGLAMLSQQSPEMFDGRFAVLTHGGERIPLAAVEPIFACSIPFNGGQRGLSQAVQATVYRLQTPAGEVFTLPLKEIRALHALTPELIGKMQAALGEVGESEPGSASAQPFGLAAFTALPKIAAPAPEHPTE